MVQTLTRQTTVFNEDTNDKLTLLSIQWGILHSTGLQLMPSLLSRKCCSRTEQTSTRPTYVWTTFYDPIMIFGDVVGRTPLYLAACNGLDLVDVLLKNGADVNKADNGTLWLVVGD